ncbi:MAG TPA: AtpZ/AtpI family protein [Propionibacteriaceae bacterium]|nr:AtpZ/AtpI family protein [Propionibacteriaceae bacterium]
MDDHREPPLREVKAQHRGELAGMDQGMRVLSYLIAGVLVYGALGWVGDHYLGTSFLLPIGIVLGAAGGCYVIIRRYGQFAGVPDAGTVTRDTVRNDEIVMDNKLEDTR